MKLVERFKPVAADKIDWSMTIDDSQTWTKPWTFAMTLTADPHQPLFEYACHEGNMAMRNALSAERAHEKAVADAIAKGLPPPERVFERVNGADRAR